MTAFEILYFNQELLKRLFESGLKISDYKYVDLYIDYEKMLCEGDKVIYIVSNSSLKIRQA
mgnify:CR=1 FL=1